MGFKCGMLVLLIGLQVVVGERLLKSPRFNETRLYHDFNSADSQSILEKASAVGLQVLQHDSNIGFSVNVSVGSLNQKFHLQLDLSTTTTWVPSKDCKSICADFCSIEAICQISCEGRCCSTPSTNPNYACGLKHRFDSEHSSSFVESRKGQTFSIDDGDASTVKGTFGADDFKFSSALTNAKGAEFGLATDLSLSFTQFSADGVLGLAKKANAPTDPKPVASSFDNQLFQLAFVKCYKDRNYCGGAAFGNEALFHKKYCSNVGPVTFQTNTNDWGFKINSFNLNDTVDLKGDWQVAMDINSPLVTLNSELLEKLTNLTKAVFEPETFLYRISCLTKFEWKLSANGKHFLVMNQDSFITYNPNNGKCYLQFQPKDQFDTSAADIKFGLPVISSYCQEFKISDETLTFYELNSKTV